MTKGKKKRNRQSSNAPVPDTLNASDSSDSGELKSQPANSESALVVTNSTGRLRVQLARFCNVNVILLFQFSSILVLMSKKPST